MSTTTLAHRNGIDVDQLVATIGAIHEDAALAEFTFRATSTWVDGTWNTGRIRGFTHAGREDDTRQVSFTLHGGEPSVLLGEDHGPNAVELLLQALGFCYSVGFVANAAARGIEVSELTYDVEGDLDVQAFLGLSGPRAGFTEIRVRARVSSPNATEDELRDLCEHVQATSPVRDTLANPVPVETVLEIV